ncbi:MAG TPA: hypothetical protein VFU71_17220 [Burkholderiaceae bacterium]|nr:hypothetical protein [Burkholderiaceae bacterium]
MPGGLEAVHLGDLLVDLGGLERVLPASSRACTNRVFPVPASAADQRAAI